MNRTCDARVDPGATLVGGRRERYPVILDAVSWHPRQGGRGGERRRRPGYFHTAAAAVAAAGEEGRGGADGRRLGRRRENERCWPSNGTECDLQGHGWWRGWIPAEPATVANKAARTPRTIARLC